MTRMILTGLIPGVCALIGVFLALGSCSSIRSIEDAGEAGDGVTTRVIYRFGTGAKVYRFVDEEHGIVCYLATGEGFDCEPLVGDSR